MAPTERKIKRDCLRWFDLYRRLETALVGKKKTEKEKDKRNKLKCCKYK